MEQWSDVLKPLLPRPNTRLDVSADNAGCQYHFGRHLKPSHARIDQSKSRCSPPTRTNCGGNLFKHLGPLAVITKLSAKNKPRVSWLSMMCICKVNIMPAL